MSFFDFESAENEELKEQAIQERGDSFRVLIDHRWLSFALIIFIIALFARIQALLAMVAFMFVVTFTTWIWSRSSLRGLVYKRKLPYYRFFPDETFEIQILVENRKLLPVPWLHAEDEWPVAISPTDHYRLSQHTHDPDIGYLINSYSLRWFERIRRPIPAVTQRRGIFEIGPTHLLSGDPFSLFDRKLTLSDQTESVIVYPRIKPIEELGLPLKDPFGDKRVQRRLFEDPSRMMGIRDYSPQDSFRHIHWKASARAGTLQTRVFEPTHSLQIVLALNVATYEQHWRGVWPEMLEYAIEITASLANWALGQDHAVGLSANGTLAHADQPFRIAPSRNQEQLTHILETLAGVSYFVTASFDRFLLAESPRLPWGATLVLITPFVNEAMGATVLRLRDSGRRVVLIQLGKTPPPVIPRIITYHLPIADEEPPLPEEDQAEAEETVDHLTPRQRYLLRQRQEGTNHVR
jgi:uncharacterized protein (DUF58 family)